jgi:hypothetical protein
VVGIEVLVTPARCVDRKRGGSAMTPAKILFLELTNNVGADRVVSALANAGAECALISPPDSYCCVSRSVSRHYPLPRQRGLWMSTLRVKRRLEQVCQAWQPDWIVPLDDIAAWQLRSLASCSSVSESVRLLLRKSLGAPAGYEPATMRSALLDRASALGVRAPVSIAVRTLAEAREAAARVGFPLVLKLEHTCGGAGVKIIQSPGELEAEIAAHTRWRHELRTAMKHAIWRQAGLDWLDAPPFNIQAHVDGGLGMRTVVAVNGRVLSGVSFAAIAVHPEPTGPCSVLRPIQHAAMDAAAAQVASDLRASGFLSFDFVLAGNGEATLIELNARPVGSVHLGTRFGHDVCGALAAHIEGRPIPADAEEAPPDIEVALFPKELERDPASPRLWEGSGVLHDVPWSDPPVVAAYLKALAKTNPARMKEIDQVMSWSHQVVVFPWPSLEAATPI